MFGAFSLPGKWVSVHHKLRTQVRTANANMDHIPDGFVGKPAPVTAADIINSGKKQFLGFHLLFVRLLALGAPPLKTL